MAGGGGQGLQALLPWAGGGQPMQPGPSAGASPTIAGMAGGGGDPFGAPMPAVTKFIPPTGAQALQGRGAPGGAATGGGAGGSPAMTPAMLQILIKRMLGTS